MIKNVLKLGLLFNNIIFGTKLAIFLQNTGEYCMPITHKHVISLLDFVKIDRFYVVCHFKCKTSHKSVISTVPFEPFEGRIEITWKDILLHPIDSYNRYYHTPITIYGKDCHETIVLKAFKRVAKNFRWNEKTQEYVYN